ncbi:hypothetical protein BAUCODRAFT_79376 [Baudoinia panamericana UAMH 10762]|uniref:Major facilitator superfamily (MFS) profile domain-containing protein n=1 Tax=Baudoinia panamericana (strain UAMH 10762) TaxID=717646 RepID=M2MKD9_BAUPA|nr:uncharacterized protein BAUCODRAFT_79376 [Baudoinia panamericana UAMH 10762]EMC91793.1 hypothetical protein BAUCODRAFT_79376 [Baudoinia panamericana UAMH 10762]
MTQFLAEYLISGFAIALPKLTLRVDSTMLGPGTLGLFWPATLLTLVLSAALLIFARVADIRGGYGIFVLGLLWLSIWTLLPGFFENLVVLDVARAMQGLAIAAFMPSTFVMVSSFYHDGPRKNFVLGLYSGCAPLGFCVGFFISSACPDGKPQWYLWTASIMAFVTAITAYLTIPHDWTDRKQLGLKMDWVGAILITSGLILLNYALAYEPSANLSDKAREGFSYPEVYVPFAVALVLLLAAVWWEGWMAVCPILPFDFFRTKGVLAFSLAGLCFYGAYGVWLYESAQYFASDTGVTSSVDGLQGTRLALWYVPTAIGGLVLCVLGGGLMHIIPFMVLLLISAIAWVVAPLLLAVCPTPLNYWATVLPSMLCATIGIDLTYTLTLVYFSSAQPKRYQGLCGAVCSILINLGMSFSLPLSEIVETKALSSAGCSGVDVSGYEQCINSATNWSYRTMFMYAAASAGLGLVICVLFVRFPQRAATEKSRDEERPRDTLSKASSLVEDRGMI